MPTFATPDKYRNDIDGLRAVAVLAVIAFHFGVLPCGYLGVDVFFVISGFLITGIITREIDDGKFSIVQFYLRRTRRILPLVLFVSAVALGLGVAVMLPDDLENLGQSVIATSLFGNNVLQAVTTRNYWDVANEFKPLMHTWSLGVEEQYYLIYPLLFALLRRGKRRAFVIGVGVLLAVSVGLYLAPFPAYQKFYLIHFRFWELAVGGLAAVGLRGRVIRHRVPGLVAVALVGLLLAGGWLPTFELRLILATLLSVAVLSADNSAGVGRWLLANPVSVAVGRISFSLYMWHQVVLAFARYLGEREIGPLTGVLLFLLMLGLSAATYFWVEQPFRTPKRVSTKRLLATVIGGTLVVNAVAGYVYWQGGVIRDVPELDLLRGSGNRQIHSEYNSRIYSFDRPFAADGRRKVLVVGNSFARDWVNVLLESRFADQLDVTYVYDPAKHAEFTERVAAADVVFVSVTDADRVGENVIPAEKMWVVGTKNFGVSNGSVYNHPRGPDYPALRVEMARGQLELNRRSADRWGDRYLDYISLVADADGRVPAFTPDGKFISQDCRHFTRPGAVHFARLFEGRLASILGLP